MYTVRGRGVIGSKAPAALALEQREGSSVQCRGQSKKAKTTSTHGQREEGSCDFRGQNKKAATTALTCTILSAALSN